MTKPSFVEFTNTVLATARVLNGERNLYFTKEAAEYLVKKKMATREELGNRYTYSLTEKGKRLARSAKNAAKATEAVNHPAHYGGADDPYEAIKVIEAWGLGFHVGNTVKYISRAGKKDPAKELEDLQKARWYLDRKISELRSKRE